MTFLEKDLENIIYDAIEGGSYHLIQQRGIYVEKPYMYRRQFKIGNYGIADIVTLSRIDKFVIAVWELKQNKIDLNSLLQLVGYMKGIKEWLSYSRDPYRYRIEGVLIGRDIAVNSSLSGNWVYLGEFFDSSSNDLFGSVSAYSYDYGLDGLSFEYHDLSGYKLTDSGFKFK